MKTKLTSFLKRTGLLLALACLFVPLNTWADPVAISFGSSQSYMFPGAGTSTNATYVALKSIDNPYYCLSYPSPIGSNCFYQITGGAIDIEAASGYIIKQVTIYEAYDPDSGLSNGTTKIKFSSSNIYSDLSPVGVTVSITGITAWNVADDPCVVVAPSNAKSARIFTENSQWGQDIYRIIVTVDEAPACANPVIASFVASGNESLGSAPSNINACEDENISIPDNGTLVYDNKHIFVGWNDGVNTYAPASVYTMHDENVQFTAVWKELNVINLAITNPENNTIPLSWSIPGICDLSNPVAPMAQQTGTTSSMTYSNNDSSVTVIGTMPQYEQFGVAFAIPTTANMEWISFAYSGTLNSQDGLWGGVCDASNAYWHFEDPLTLKPNASWQQTGHLVLNQTYWGEPYAPSVSNPLTQSVSQVAIYANTGIFGGSSGTFAVKNVRYHIADQEDIHHIVLMRKPDAIPNDTTDGTKIYSGTKSKFTDSDTKTPGTTYYYAIFAVYDDVSHSVSSPVYVSHTMEAATEYTVTYAKGADNVTGDVPTEGDHIAGAHFTVASKGNLARPGYTFAGWNDGSNDYAVGDTYTMPAENVTLTAQWNTLDVPEVTNLAVGAAINNTVPLSWKIPGIIDLTTATIDNITEDNYAYDFRVPVSSWTMIDGEALDVTYTCDQWAMCGIAFPVDIDDLEGISVECKTNDNYDGGDPGSIILGAHAGAGNVYYDDGIQLPILSNFASHTSTLAKKWYNHSGVASLDDVDEVCVFINPNPSQENSHFYIRNLRYHCTNQVDIDHIVLMRKVGSAATDTANAEGCVKLYSGKLSNFIDDDVKTNGTAYYYTVFSVHADGTLSDAVTVSHTVVLEATCTVSYENGDGVGDAPIDATEYAKGNEITLPAIGTVYKPFSAFTGWKKGNAGDLLAAGSTYTVTAADVEAETISFTAQWEEDNTTRRIPAEHILNYSNQSTSVATTDYWEVTGDSENDICLDMRNQTAEWRVFIEPGYYDISTICAVPNWGISYRLSIVDPLTDAQVMELFYEHTSGDGNTAIIRNLSKMFDLTSLVPGKQYIIRVKDTWPNCGLLVHDINITKHAPIEIPDETHFDKDNAFSSVTTATDMDIDGEAGNDELINLDRKYVEWDVKVAPGVYNVSLVYGAPEYSVKVSVALIDPENPESVIYLSKDGNYTYYYKSGSVGTPHHYVGTTTCDLTGINGNKTYRLRISDEYGTSNHLRVKDLTFTPVDPIAISNVTDTRLDATNTIQTPTMATDLDIDDDSNLDNLMNLYNTNAEWQVTLKKGLYNVQLVYGAPGYSIKVAVKLIDPTDEEADRVLSIQGDNDYYEKSNPAVTEEDKATTPHHYTSATQCALLDVTEDKIYKVRVADVYPKCNLRVSHVLFTPIAPLEIHEEASLDASNVMIAPSIVDSRIDISNQKEAVWYATIDPYKYDITLTYSAVSGDTKVRFAIIPVGGDTIFVHQENQHNADNTTYTIQALDQNLTGIASGICKIIVKDNYGHNGSKPQIISLTFSRAITTHTRSGLHAGDYGTVCLPYAIEAANINGAEIYKLIEWPAGSCAVTLEQVDNMEAGHPYIYQATANTATWSYYAEGDPTDATSENGLIGSYTTELIDANANNYIVYNNKLYYVDSEAYVGANRAYINRTDAENAPTPGPANGRKRIQMAVNGAQVVTGMDQINDQLQVTKFVENGVLYIIRDGKTYNAQGQLVK